MGLNPRFLALLYIAIVLAPLALSWTGARPPRSIWDELASGAGMLAFAIILAEFVLSGRFRAISGRIGMDNTMRFHQLFARLALGLAIIHPFLYRAPFNPPYPWDDTRQLTLTTDITAILTGVLGWVLLPALVLTGIWRAGLDYSYETWRLMHGIGAVLIAGLLLHHSLYAGRYSQDPALTWVWIGLFSIAVFTLMFVYIIRPLLQLRTPWTVQSVRPVGRKTWELTLEPRGHDGLNYRAGEFVWLNVGKSPFLLAENPFSISSAPASGPRLRFIIKELGDFTRSVGGIKPGTVAYVDGPHGNLVLPGRDEPGVALIAGGVGIAPLIGILRQMRLDGDGRPVALVYGNRTEDQIVCRDELETFDHEQSTQVVHVLGEPPANWLGRTGMIDAELVRELFSEPDKREWTYILCGPAGMLDVVEDALVGLGVPARQILSEKFQYD